MFSNAFLCWLLNFKVIFLGSGRFLKNMNATLRSKKKKVERRKTKSLPIIPLILALASKHQFLEVIPKTLLSIMDSVEMLIFLL